MYKKIFTIILVASFAHASLSIPVSAKTAVKEMIAQKVDCSKANNTVEIKYCSQQSYQAADKQLNQVYRQVISNLNGEARQLLNTAQQAWIRFRDNNCDFEVYDNRGGTGYEIFRNGCLERVTKQRTKDLRAYLSSR
ncbi:MAG: lysozyme inhibitor LprI family protein [Rhizonema sp. PD37]|nr:lysozyme inhibitor LprI family protein [Rhizonema sp. PD37]